MAIVWSKLANSERSAQAVCTTGTETQAFAATDGMQLAGVDAYVVVLSAGAGQTLSGTTGSLQAWFYDPVIGRWARAPDYDLTFASAMAGNRDAIFKGAALGIGQAVNAQRGSLGFSPNGITTSSGGVTIQILAASARGIK